VPTPLKHPSAASCAIGSPKGSGRATRKRTPAAVPVLLLPPKVYCSRVVGARFHQRRKVRALLQAPLALFEPRQKVLGRTLGRGQFVRILIRGQNLAEGLPRRPGSHRPTRTRRITARSQNRTQTRTHGPSHTHPPSRRRHAHVKARAPTYVPISFQWNEKKMGCCEKKNGNSVYRRQCGTLARSAARMRRSWTRMSRLRQRPIRRRWGASWRTWRSCTAGWCSDLRGMRP
jgi:hypothetical protein